MAAPCKSWEEVVTAKTENRRELNLQGASINDRIKKNGFDESVFHLTHLNLLKIAGTPLQCISPSLGDLVQLTSLILENNLLEELPKRLGSLTLLKFLDISGNKLKELPPSLSDLVNLQSLNANLNELATFPDLSKMKFLAYLSISKNRLSSIPEGMCHPNLTLLSTVDAAHNDIISIPQEIAQLTHLTKLNVMANKLTDLPPELSECPKLKELTISENKMKDRKLLKLAVHSTKSLLSYLNGQLEKKRAAEDESGKSRKATDKKKKGKKKAKDDIEDLIQDVFSVLRFDDSLVVSVNEAVSTVRPYIVCCALRGLDFAKSNNMFKRFIQIQTKLHEGICDKRQVATIATHDLKIVKGPLVYDACLPAEIEITPLFKSKATSAETMVMDLRAEADAFRKEKKRSTVSGIHKYLDLLKDKTHYPCLKDAGGDVISFPPITNSEKTKITKETTDILVEVTSSDSLDKCKKVMEELLHAILLTGVGSPSTGSSNEAAANEEGEEGAEALGVVDMSRVRVSQSLTVEQVKVVSASDGSLKVIYPSRIDLQNDDFNVIRNYE